MEISIIKQNMDKLLDQSFISRLFNERLGEFYPHFQQVQNIDFHVHKKHTGKTSMIVVVEYVLKFLSTEGQTEELILFSSAHSDGSRVRAFYAQDYLYHHGFDQGQYLVGRPLFYQAEQFAFFYQAVTGRTLRKLIKQNTNLNFSKFLDLSAQWIKKLHNSPIDQGNKFSQFNVREMSPKPQVFLNDLGGVYPVLGQRLQSIYSRLCALQEKNANTYSLALIHGDYHPENIIFKSAEPNNVKVIDFTDLALGDPMVDLGSFIQQFDFMCFECLDRQAINQYKEVFLEDYFGRKFADIAINELNRINFFQAWAVMRTTLLLFYAKSASHPLSELIEEVDRYLSLGENNHRKVNLY